MVVKVAKYAFKSVKCRFVTVTTVFFKTLFYFKFTNNFKLVFK